MFDYLPYDCVSARATFELMGVHIQNDTFNMYVRDDLRLLLATGDSAKTAVKKITEAYTKLIRDYLDGYDAEFYERMLVLCTAYYLEQNGYYEESVFEKAIGYLDDDSTLKPFYDAVAYEKEGVNGWNAIMFDLFGDNAEEAAAQLGKRGGIAEKVFEQSKTPRTISCILCLSRPCKRNLVLRRKELARIRNLLVSRPHLLKKPKISDVISGSRNYRFASDFEEGDVVAYRICGGRLAGKWVVLTLDYLREFPFVRCEKQRLVSAYEEFVLFDSISEEFPSAPPSYRYRALGEEDGHLISHIEIIADKKEYKRFCFVPLGKTEPPRFERYFTRKSEPVINCSAPVATVEELDELLNDIFGE